MKISIATDEQLLRHMHRLADLERLLRDEMTVGQLFHQVVRLCMDWIYPLIQSPRQIYKSLQAIKVMRLFMFISTDFVADVKRARLQEGDTLLFAKTIVADISVSAPTFNLSLSAISVGLVQECCDLKEAYKIYLAFVTIETLSAADKSNRDALKQYDKIALISCLCREMPDEVPSDAVEAVEGVAEFLQAKLSS